MAGHSKWANIRHRKGAADARRNRIFTKLAKELTVSARLGGGDPQGNPRLRAALLKARGENMPKDTVDKAIKKGLGETGGTEYVNLVYEAYGPGGVALLIDCLTDNKNRTVSDVRSLLTKAGGRLATNGSVSYLFQRRGVIVLDAQCYSEERILECVLDAGALEVEADENFIHVLTDDQSFETVIEALGKDEIEIQGAELKNIPETSTQLEGDLQLKVEALIERLEECEDVQSVVSNAEFSEDGL